MSIEMMKKTVANDYTVQELMAVFLSRDLKDGETAHLGANQPVPRAAVLLAHLTHAPNMKISQSLTVSNLIHEAKPQPYSEFFTDWRRSRWAESYRLGHEVFADVKRFADFFFLGAIQIDQFGNSNLIGIGKSHHQLAFRGPGSGAAAVASTYCKRMYLISGSHDRRIFVKACDFISAFGWGSGGADAREKLKLPGGGPRYVVTPLCVMEFGSVTKKMRLKSVHPGVEVEEVIQNTGFELELPDIVPYTDPPTETEIATIRQRIDLNGQLRG